MVTMLDREAPAFYKGAWQPKSRLGRLARLAAEYLPGDLAEELVDAAKSAVVAESELSIEVIKRDGRRVNHGVVSRKMVTNNGVAFIVDGFQGLVTMQNMKFHGLGTTNTAEDAADSALAAELSTQYSADNIRGTGTVEEGASANIYKSMATVTVDAAVALVEHGLFTQAATGGGTMLDRSVFSVINLGSGESLVSTYQFTITAGG